MTRIYFDNAATTPMDEEVLEAMIPMMREHFGNPSSIHAHGRKVRTEIEKARKTIAQLLGASPSEIFFTSGGTEADNMAIRCTIHDHQIKRAISSPIEHHAVLHPLEELHKEGLISLEFVNILPNGHIDLDHLRELLNKEGKALVTLMHGNNEIGNMIDLHEVGNLCEEHQAIFHSDTVQTMGHFRFNLSETPVHFINGAGHKFNGPKGVGFIYISSDVAISPLIHGGAQERNMRGGTENVYGIVGLAKALEIAYRDLDHKYPKIQAVKSYMIEQLRANFPDIQFNGDPEGPSLYTVLNVSFPPTDKGEMLLFNLDIGGVSASGGSACTSGSDIGSHVLRGIGAPSNRPSVRFSFGKQNTFEEVDYVIQKLKEILN